MSTGCLGTWRGALETSEELWRTPATVQHLQSSGVSCSASRSWWEEWGDGDPSLVGILPKAWGFACFSDGITADVTLRVPWPEMNSRLGQGQMSAASRVRSRVGMEMFTRLGLGWRCLGRGWGWDDVHQAGPREVMSSRLWCGWRCPPNWS